jgi:hypothetical protein
MAADTSPEAATQATCGPNLIKSFKSDRNFLDIIRNILTVRSSPPSSRRTSAEGAENRQPFFLGAVVNFSNRLR